MALTQMGPSEKGVFENGGIISWLKSVFKKDKQRPKATADTTSSPSPPRSSFGSSRKRIAAEEVLQSSPAKTIPYNSAAASCLKATPSRLRLQTWLSDQQALQPSADGNSDVDAPLSARCAEDEGYRGRFSSPGVLTTTTTTNNNTTATGDSRRQVNRGRHASRRNTLLFGSLDPAATPSGQQDSRVLSSQSKPSGGHTEIELLDPDDSQHSFTSTRCEESEGSRHSRLSSLKSFTTAPPSPRGVASSPGAAAAAKAAATAAGGGGSSGGGGGTCDALLRQRFQHRQGQHYHQERQQHLHQQEEEPRSRNLTINRRHPTDPNHLDYLHHDHQQQQRRQQQQAQQQQQQQQQQRHQSQEYQQPQPQPLSYHRRRWQCHAHSEDGISPHSSNRSVWSISRTAPAGEQTAAADLAPIRTATHAREYAFRSVGGGGGGGAANASGKCLSHTSNVHQMYPASCRRTSSPGGGPTAVGCGGGTATVGPMFRGTSHLSLNGGYSTGAAPGIGSLSRSATHHGLHVSGGGGGPSHRRAGSGGGFGSPCTSGSTASFSPAPPYQRYNSFMRHTPPWPTAALLGSTPSRRTLLAAPQNRSRLGLRMGGGSSGGGGGGVRSGGGSNIHSGYQTLSSEGLRDESEKAHRRRDDCNLDSLLSTGTGVGSGYDSAAGLALGQLPGAEDCCSPCSVPETHRDYFSSLPGALLDGSEIEVGNAADGSRGGSSSMSASKGINCMLCIPGAAPCSNVDEDGSGGGGGGGGGGSSSVGKARNGSRGGACTHDGSLQPGAIGGDRDHLGDRSDSKGGSRSGSRGRGNMSCEERPTSGWRRYVAAAAAEAAAAALTVADGNTGDAAGISGAGDGKSPSAAAAAAAPSLRSIKRMQALRLRDSEPPQRLLVLEDVGDGSGAAAAAAAPAAAVAVTPANEQTVPLQSLMSEASTAATADVPMPATAEASLSNGDEAELAASGASNTTSRRVLRRTIPFCRVAAWNVPPPEVLGGSDGDGDDKGKVDDSNGGGYDHQTLSPVLLSTLSQSCSLTSLPPPPPSQLQPISTALRNPAKLRPLKVSWVEQPLSQQHAAESSLNPVQSHATEDQHGCGRNTDVAPKPEGKAEEVQYGGAVGGDVSSGPQATTSTALTLAAASAAEEEDLVSAAAADEEQEEEEEDVYQQQHLYGSVKSDAVDAAATKGKGHYYTYEIRPIPNPAPMVTLGRVMSAASSRCHSSSGVGIGANGLRKTSSSQPPFLSASSMRSSSAISIASDVDDSSEGHGDGDGGNYNADSLYDRYDSSSRALAAQASLRRSLRRSNAGSSSRVLSAVAAAMAGNAELLALNPLLWGQPGQQQSQQQSQQQGQMQRQHSEESWAAAGSSSPTGSRLLARKAAIRSSMRSSSCAVAVVGSSVEDDLSVVEV